MRRPQVDPRFLERLRSKKSPEQAIADSLRMSQSMPDLEQRLKSARSAMDEGSYRELCATTHAAILEYYKDTNKPLPEGVPAFLANAETDEILAVATLLRKEKGEVVN